MSDARKILLAQGGVAVAAGLLGWVVAGAVAAYSAWIGGAICVLPSAYLALRMGAARATGVPRKMLHAAYWGEAGKLALTAALFALAFMLVRPLSAGALLLGFIGTQSAIWLALLTDDGGLENTPAHQDTKRS